MDTSHLYKGVSHGASSSKSKDELGKQAEFKESNESFRIMVDCRAIKNNSAMIHTDIQWHFCRN